MKKTWAIISAILIVFSIVTGALFIDDRYISADELTKAQKTIYLRLDMSEYNVVTEQFYKIMILTKQNPDDADLQKQLDTLKQTRAELKAKIDAAIENN
jgi:cell division protein FtsB